MKCVQNIKTHEVTRVSDDIADRLEAAGTHKKVSKELWKKQGRKN